MNASPAHTRISPVNIPEAVEAVRSAPGRLLPVGAGTKTGLSRGEATALSLQRLNGIVDYDPSEFTLTALAGTPLRAVAEELEKHGQSLPFDPPLGAAGATIGGAIASGLSGPGRYRYGGLRDFILQTRFVTGRGELVRGGAKVVKNAAGFDWPKLLVGSLGRLGVIVEATFKVFPHARSYATLAVTCRDIPGALDAATHLGRSVFDIEALEFEPPGQLFIRLGGALPTFPDRLARLDAFLGAAALRVRRCQGEEEAALWTIRLDRWENPAQGGSPVFIVKVPLTPNAIGGLDADLERAGATRSYLAGGQAAWVRWIRSEAELGLLLQRHRLGGLVVQGPSAGPLLGYATGEEFRRRVKTAVDPENRFPDY